ncbi:RagB/SusD family nutrient uptake outer membrane protein [Sphingobacterium olei]|uniref:RagB/SusD family nutrient uptake outer membrane protein n=1 Tax=Sphingobacterium olei TaxID=2571155 RepID=A0A4U0PJ83_9SPHI|nr:RagB/SusD family nutrient uptake outer membrane protein [Sphingobacterium olei]TJZ62954.1 RagB/SusD family nutrient uptake outer membrane protein [Sphingobacterium olei]
MNIQQVKIYSTLTLLLFGLSGCKKFLNVMPVGQTTIPVLFSDMDGIRSAIPGAYAKTYDYYTNHFYLYPELAGDLLQADLQQLAEGRQNIYNYNSDPDQEAAPSAKIWSDILASLANVNNALFYLPSLEEKYPGSRNELAVYKAELLFLRALGHFDLCRAYAQPYTYTTDASHIGVPILSQTPGPDDVVTRQPVKEVYAFVLRDLKEADQIYNDNRNDFRTAKQRPYFASKEAVQALLSRVYLYMEDWDQVIRYANEVISERQLARGGNYTSMYFDLAGPETETIFRLNGQDKGSGLLSFFNFRNANDFVLPQAYPAEKFVGLFDEGTNDLRINALLFKLETNPGQSANFIGLTRKFDAVQTATDGNRQHMNPLVLRVSEIYLNRAEAYIGKKQAELAAADVETIRARGLQTSGDDIILPENDLDAMRNIVYEERIRELAFEGHRLFDITRRKQNLVRNTNTNSTVKELTYPSDYFVLPIPQRELDANTGMKGNPTVNN